ncbi:hypothetical protein [Azoarcus sp. KH32C]|uniref:hypothetical protein n=1 Tax=Azoarcus sp. KH32C TaxID=748247 RepID=UPI0012E9EFF1|nr:hypothetical protein [Azoarcus sp. KH32C]
MDQMLRADRFAEFGKAALAEIDFLDADAGHRRERAAQARAQERARLHTGKELARVLLRQIAPDAPERGELQRAAAGELGLKDLDAVLARARQTLFQPATPQLSADQQALAARLAGGEKTEDFEVWRGKQAVSSRGLEALMGHISELELLGQAGRASELQQEVLAAAAIPEDAVREMRFDSLVNSLKRAKEDAVALEKLRRRAAFLGTELARHREGTEVQQTLQAAARGGISELQAAVTAGEQRLAELKATQVADARRRAVLDGLQQLGYQVHEELSTATSAGGQLVVRNPASTGYGVAITAGAGMERLQMRTVAFDANRDSSGDIPAEQRWCDDFGALKGALKAQGSEVIVERAEGVGAFPLKLLSTSTEIESPRGTIAPRQALKK